MAFLHCPRAAGMGNGAQAHSISSCRVLTGTSLSPPGKLVSYRDTNLVWRPPKASAKPLSRIHSNIQGGTMLRKRRLLVAGCTIVIGLAILWTANSVLHSGDEIQP